MKKEGKVMKAIDKIFNFAEDHQREIFLGTQIVGTVMTGVLCWRAATKAEKVLEKHKKRMDDIKDEYDSVDNYSEEEFKENKKRETIDTIKDMAPIVLPPIITGGMTIGLAVGGYKASTRQIAALSAAYALSEKALSEYKDKALELIGPKKTQTITDEINQNKITAAPPKSDTIITTGRGNVLCYDDYSGRYFYSDPESIRSAVNDINEQMIDEVFVSLNEFYDKLGLPDVKLGEDLGFCIDDGKLNVSWSATLTKDNVPCLVLNYDISPAYGYGVRGKSRRYG